MAMRLPEASRDLLESHMKRAGGGAVQAIPSAHIESISNRITLLFSGAKDSFADVELCMHAVPEFNQKVYAITRSILPGHTLTYGEIARRMGDAGAARAVGKALGENPFPPVVPCHRVLSTAIGSAVKLGGFSGGDGVKTKLRMLQIEQAQIGEEPSLF